MKTKKFAVKVTNAVLYSNTDHYEVRALVTTDNAHHHTSMIASENWPAYGKEILQIEGSRVYTPEQDSFARAVLTGFLRDCQEKTKKWESDHNLHQDCISYQLEFNGNGNVTEARVEYEDKE